jgi:hypothetical protein
VYAGHAAVALVLKTRDPRVPMAPLVLACYGPDWLEMVLGLWHGRAAMGLLTHYLPGLFLGALAAAALYAIVFQRPGGWTILLAWLLHWPADFFTAHKGLLTPTDRIGLDLYNLPLADCVLEASVVLVCCVLYARTFAHGRTQRRWVAAMAAALIVLQALLNIGMAQGDPVWRPSLARREWRPHPGAFPAAAATSSLRMPLALPSLTPTVSERWRSMVCEA